MDQTATDSSLGGEISRGEIALDIFFSGKGLGSNRTLASSYGEQPPLKFRGHLAEG